MRLVALPWYRTPDAIQPRQSFSASFLALCTTLEVGQPRAQPWEPLPPGWECPTRFEGSNPDSMGAGWIGARAKQVEWLHQVIRPFATSNMSHVCASEITHFTRDYQV